MLGRVLVLDDLLNGLNLGTKDARLVVIDRDVRIDNLDRLRDPRQGHAGRDERPKRVMHSRSDREQLEMLQAIELQADAPVGLACPLSFSTRHHRPP